MIKNINFIRAAVIIAALSLPAVLSGCKKAYKYTADDIQSVSVSCSSMDYSYSYSFLLSRVKNDWLLSADFASDPAGAHIIFEDCVIKSGEADKVLDIISSQKLISAIQKYKESQSKWFALDETTYSAYIRFSEGRSISAPIDAGEDLKAYFYCLGEKYAGTESDN